MGDLELSAAEFQALYERLRGHAQWGSDDRRGALNHITAPRLLAAAREVQLGRSVTMASPLARQRGRQSRAWCAQHEASAGRAF